jgi:hypothetical protein
MDIPKLFYHQKSACLLDLDPKNLIPTTLSTDRSRLVPNLHGLSPEQVLVILNIPIQYAEGLLKRSAKKFQLLNDPFHHDCVCKMQQLLRALGVSRLNIVKVKPIKTLVKGE